MPPAPETDRRVKADVKIAFSDATMKSHASARLNPVPAAGPRTSAMVGFSMRRSRYADSE